MAQKPQTSRTRQPADTSQISKRIPLRTTDPASPAASDASLPAGTPSHFLTTAWVDPFLGEHPEWKEAVTLFHECGRPQLSTPLALLTAPAMIAFIAWERRQRIHTKAEAAALLQQLGLTPSMCQTAAKG
jgi:hypothetical protein